MTDAVTPMPHTGPDVEFAGLDELDRDLIFRLQIDGRLPSAQLARELQLDQRTVRRRVERLLDEQVIRIAAVADPRALGYSSMAMVCLTTAPGANFGAMYDEICAMREVDYVTRTTGPHSIQAEVMCGSERELLEVLTSFEAHPGIRSFEVLRYLRLHYQRAWFSDTDRSPQPRGVRPIGLDPTDHRMVSILARDGRTKFAALSYDLGISESMARKRYQALTRSNAMRVVAIANPLHLGFSATSWVAISCNGAAGWSSVAEALTQVDEVTYVVLTAGRFDIIAEIVCGSHEHLISVVDAHIRAISGVERAEVWPYLELRYKPLLPH
ncbi:Lrp/AsnC family transcriptional regulator [Leucobacter sp. W1038]|uniref:Lrp/AsnC family transcriptional regulator n=1 Tax=Leucobacter sp. W1038 TaxID=3438281 RepID=UPI003D96DAC7